jgi:trimethylamine--corrinoid protein Co-methyltransferase
MPAMRSNSRRRQNRSDSRPAIEQMDWTLGQWIDRPTEPVDEDTLEKVHQNALRILEEIGILFLNSEARDILRGIGCEVDDVTENVRFDRALVLDAIAKAPGRFTITPRNEDRQIILGDGHFLFSCVASTPNVSDLDGGRRVGNRPDYQNLLRLTQYFNCLHFNAGYPVEPVDIHASIRHLDCIYDMLTLTDKVVHAYALGSERIEDAMDMVRIAAGLTEDEFQASPRMFTNINSTSPLKHDWPMLDGAMRAARRGQVVFISPFTLAGAMAPVTIAGAVTQQNAEGLAAVALLQQVREGAPCVYGAFTSNVDMKTGAPAFGTPEYVRAMQMSGQMARRYGLPWRASNANACNAPDAQAIWESVFSLQGSCSGHANMIYHAAGWMEGGLSASFEKFVIDCEVLQQIIYTNRPVPISEDDLAVEAIGAVGPFGHFFGAEHTKERFRDAFYAPLMSDWRNYESWEESGALWTHQRANAAWKQILAEYEKPPLDTAVDEELCAFVARRKKEGGAPTDF